MYLLERRHRRRRGSTSIIGTWPGIEKPSFAKGQMRARYPNRALRILPRLAQMKMRVMTSVSWLRKVCLSKTPRPFSRSPPDRLHQVLPPWLHLMTAQIPRFHTLCQTGGSQSLNHFDLYHRRELLSQKEIRCLPLLPSQIHDGRMLWLAGFHAVLHDSVAMM